MEIVKRTAYLAGRLVNSLLNPLGYEVRPFVDDSDGRLLTAKYILRQNERIADAFTLAIEGTRLAEKGERAHVLELVMAFRQLHLSVPFRLTHGGSGFNNCLNLFLVANLVQPSVILESGTFKGMTSWVLRNAAPRAALHCFDLTFSRLKYTHSTIQYHQKDIMTEALQFAPSDRVLAFFDDHVSQAQRIQDSRKLNANFIVFDDSYEPDTLYIDKAPPVPTIPMILDDDIVDAEIIEWNGYRRRYCYAYALEEIRKARQEIAVCRRLPGLTEQTGYRMSYMYYVELK